MKTKPWEEEWKASPAGDPDITPRVWRADGLLVLSATTDARAALSAAAPAMARALLDAFMVLEGRPCTPVFRAEALGKVRAALAKAGVPLP